MNAPAEYKPANDPAKSSLRRVWIRPSLGGDNSLLQKGPNRPVEIVNRQKSCWPHTSFRCKFSGLGPFLEDNLHCKKPHHATREPRKKLWRVVGSIPAS